MIGKLEHWSLSRTVPTFDDRESMTVLELVGKNTTKINEIIDLVNNTIDELNTTIETFTNETNKNYEAFRIEINQKIKDFTDLTELKLAEQDAKIEEAVSYMRENLALAIENELNTLFESGELNIEFTYDESTENLNITGITRGGN